MFNAEKRRVLLADDNEATRSLIIAILQRDFDVDPALNGLDAIEKLRTNRYAVILLDLRMPEHDGFSVLDFIKENHPELLSCVLIVTASLTPKDMNRARTYGVSAIITKPFDVETFYEAVKRCADGGESGMPINMIASTPVILFLADVLKNKIG